MDITLKVVGTMLALGCILTTVASLASEVGYARLGRTIGKFAIGAWFMIGISLGIGLIASIWS